MSNMHTIIYSLFTISRRLSGGTVLTTSWTPYDRFPYGLASPVDACARELRRTLPPSPLTSEFVGMASYAPTCFLDLMDDDVESDGSSIDDVVPSHHLSWECAMVDAPGHPPAEAESSQTHTPLDPRAETPVLIWEHNEELRQQWLNQPLTTPARSPPHTALRAHKPASDARGHTRRVQRNTMDWGNDSP